MRVFKFLAVLVPLLAGLIITLSGIRESAVNFEAGFTPIILLAIGNGLVILSWIQLGGNAAFWVILFFHMFVSFCSFGATACLKIISSLNNLNSILVNMLNIIGVAAIASIVLAVYYYRFIRLQEEIDQMQVSR